MPRYVETTVVLSKEQAKALKDAIAAGTPIALSCKLHAAPSAEETAAKMALTPIQVGRVGAGRAIKITGAQSKYMRGAGFLVDAAKVGSAVGQRLADEFVPDSAAANKLSDILLESADVLERGLTGRKQFDYGQAAKNEKMAIDNAAAFLAKSYDAQLSEYLRSQKSPMSRKMSFEEFKARKAELASRSPRNAAAIKRARFARWRGDPATQQVGDKLYKKGKEAVRSKNPELFDTAMAAKDLVKSTVGKGKVGGNINQIVAAYLRKYIGEDSQTGEGARPMTGRPRRINR